LEVLIVGVNPSTHAAPVRVTLRGELADQNFVLSVAAGQESQVTSASFVIEFK
jgi:hypothetical protein